MAELIGSEGSDFNTAMPSLTDLANIQSALRYFLYGIGDGGDPANPDSPNEESLFSHLSTLDTLKAPKLDPTFTGTATAPSLRLTATTDATLTSSTHAIQVGATNSTNLVIDNNEILSRNNGGNSNLALNAKGGSVTIGDLGSTVTINGTLVGPVSSATQTELDLKANIAGPTFTGTATAPVLRLTSTSEASLSSTDHAFQVGETNSTNLAMDRNEIQARNNGLAASLSINQDGGNITLGAASSTVTVNGTLVGQFLPAGAITQFAGASAPSGYLLCRGGEFAISSYPALHAVLGTTYGALTNGSGAAGTTHFRVPNLQGRVPVGVGTAPSGNGVTEKALAAIGGDETVVLSTTQIPSHRHSIDHNHAEVTSSSDSHSHTGTTSSGGVHSHFVNNIGGTATVQSGSGQVVTDNVQGTTFSAGAHTHTFTTSSDSHSHTVNLPNFEGDSGLAGSGGAHNNLQPYIVLNYIIKT
jgi:microcystin-dependent protein